MSKLYQSPSTVVIETALMLLRSDSSAFNGDGTKAYTGNALTGGDASTAAARGAFTDWDDDEE